MKKIYIGSDHAGFDLKEFLRKNLSEENLIDLGTYSTESVDYPEYAHLVSEKISENREALGILICGSGEGVCMTANRHTAVRAALVWNNEVSEVSRKHNDANIICLPARFIAPAEALQFVRTFINTSFEGGRHERRVSKIEL